MENFYHITIMDECELVETNAFIVKIFSKPHGLLLYIYHYFTNLIAFLNVPTIEINTSPLCILCTLNGSNNAPSYTHPVHMWYEESTLRIILRR